MFHNVLEYALSYIRSGPCGSNSEAQPRQDSKDLWYPAGKARSHKRCPIVSSATLWHH